MAQGHILGIDAHGAEARLAELIGELQDAYETYQETGGLGDAGRDQLREAALRLVEALDGCDIDLVPRSASPRYEEGAADPRGGLLD